MFSGKMSFYPGALAPGNLNLALPLLPARIHGGGGVYGGHGGHTTTRHPWSSVRHRSKRRPARIEDSAYRRRAASREDPGGRGVAWRSGSRPAWGRPPGSACTARILAPAASSSSLPRVAAGEGGGGRVKLHPCLLLRPADNAELRRRPRRRSSPMPRRRADHGRGGLQLPTAGRAESIL
jgi:hypothetical protein